MIDCSNTNLYMQMMQQQMLQQQMMDQYYMQMLLNSKNNSVAPTLNNQINNLQAAELATMSVGSNGTSDSLAVGGIIGAQINHDMKAYRLSDEFSKVLKQEDVAQFAKKEAADVIKERESIKELEQRIKDAKEAGDKKLVNKLSKKLKETKSSLNKDALQVQRNIQLRSANALKNAQLEQEFYSKFLKLTQKNNQEGIKKLFSSEKYAKFAKQYNNKFLKFSELHGGTPASADTVKFVEGMQQRAVAKANSLKGTCKTIGRKTIPFGKVTTKGVSKGLGKGMLGRAGWVAAVGLEAYDTYKVADQYGWASKQTVRQATSGSVGIAGAVVGGKAGALVGAKAGAAIGTFFGGPVGSAVGIAIGGFLGGLIGGGVGYFTTKKGTEAAFDGVAGK